MSSFNNISFSESLDFGSNSSGDFEIFFSHKSCSFDDNRSGEEIEINDFLLNDKKLISLMVEDRNENTFENKENIANNQVRVSSESTSECEDKIFINSSRRSRYSKVTQSLKKASKLQKNQKNSSTDLAPELPLLSEMDVTAQKKNLIILDTLYKAVYSGGNNEKYIHEAIEQIKESKESMIRFTNSMNGEGKGLIAFARTQGMNALADTLTDIAIETTNKYILSPSYLIDSDTNSKVVVSTKFSKRDNSVNKISQAIKVTSNIGSEKQITNQVTKIEKKTGHSGKIKT